MTRSLPMVCTLGAREQLQRREELLSGLFTGIQRVEELADGFAICFPGDRQWAERLLEFVAFERECCPFMTFELAFEPEQGPIWLRLRGPDGVKKFIQDWLGHQLQEK
jgi:hypothetical protein